MTKDILLEKIKTNFTKEQLAGWLSCLPSTGSKMRTPAYFRVGDVFLHPIFHHPYILLKKRKNDWLCCLITSEETCNSILEKTQSRFFENSYFTKVLFTEKEVRGVFVNPYCNSKHVKQVLTNLKKQLL